MPDLVRRNFRQYDRDLRQTGLIAPTWIPAGTTTTLAANRGYLMRFIPSRPMAVTKLGYVVTTAAGSDDPVDVGLYDSAGAKLVSSGATTGQLNGTGTKAITVTTTVLAAGGVYYASLSCGAVGTTAAVIVGVTYGNVLGFNMFGSTIGLVEADAKASTHPLPSSWGALGAATAGTALMTVRES